MVKIQKLPSGQLVITIPKLLAEYEGLKKGMELDFKKHKGGFILGCFMVYSRQEREVRGDSPSGVRPLVHRPSEFGLAF